MLKIKFHILILLFCSHIFHKGYAQELDVLICKADSLHKEKNYRKSAKIFEKAFVLKNGTNSHYYNAARTFALAGIRIKP